MNNIITIDINNEKYLLVNWEEIIDYYKLPFYKKWFKKCPTKILTKAV